MLTLEQISEAADYMEKYGKVRGEFNRWYKGHACYCTIGAFAAASNGVLGKHLYDASGWALQASNYGYFSDFVESLPTPRGFWAHDLEKVFRWSDNRTTKEVVAYLRKFVAEKQKEQANAN